MKTRRTLARVLTPVLTLGLTLLGGLTMGQGPMSQSHAGHNDAAWSGVSGGEAGATGQNTFGGRWPGDIATVAEANAYRDLPEGVSTTALQVAAVWQMADRTPVRSATAQPPVGLTFNVHFDPVLASFQQWREQKDNLKWLRDFVASYPVGQRPYLNLQMQGDHAEFYRLLTNPDAIDGRAVLQDLVAAGHTVGTHTHKSVRGTTPSSWTSIPVSSSGHPCLDPAGMIDPSPSDLVELLTDHLSWIEQLYAQIGIVDPVAANRNAAMQLPSRFDNKGSAFAGTLSDGYVTVPHGFSIQTGGRNECFNYYFDHDVLTPWRPGPNSALDEDLSNSHTVMVPGLPDVGSTGMHYDMPIDATVPAYQRRFLQIHLQRLYSQYTGATSQVWTFGWHIHPHTLYPDGAQVPAYKKLRSDVEAFVNWLNSQFVGQTDALGQVVAEYVTIPDVGDRFLAWESAHAGQSAFEYSLTQADLAAYPYDLGGLTVQLANAHYDQALTAPGGPLQVVRFERCPHALRGETGGYWGYDPGDVLTCTDQPASGGHAQGNPLSTTILFVAWRDAATPMTVDLTSYLSQPVVAYDGVTGGMVTGDLAAWSLDFRPVILVPAAKVYAPLVVK